MLIKCNSYRCNYSSSFLFYLLFFPTRQDLIAALKYELTGKFERLIVGLMRPPAYCDAKEIKDSISVRSGGVCVCWGGDVVNGKILGSSKSNW